MIIIYMKLIINEYLIKMYVFQYLSCQAVSGYHNFCSSRKRKGMDLGLGKYGLSFGLEGQALVMKVEALP